MDICISRYNNKVLYYYIYFVISYVPSPKIYTGPVICSLEVCLISVLFAPRVNTRDPGGADIIQYNPGHPFTPCIVVIYEGPLSP